MYINTFSTLSTLLLAFSAFSPSSAAPNPQVHSVSLPLPYKVIHQYPNPIWLENLAVRYDNTILTTELYPSPSLYLVDPNAGSSTLVYNFSSVFGLLGITEVQPDIFYIAGGNFTVTTLTTHADSFAIFEVDMRPFRTSSQAQVKKLLDIPSATLLNGVTTLSHRDQTILVADSALGVVFKVDIAAATYDVAIDIPALKIPAGAKLPLGVNGIKVRDGWLYFSNSGSQTMNRVRIHPNGTVVNGAVEVLATGLGVVDDFALDKKGRLWIALNSGNTLAFLAPGSGNVTIVLGATDQLTLAGPTSCAFKRGDLDDLLFVATSGGLVGPINGTLTEGGEIVAVDTKGF